MWAIPDKIPTDAMSKNAAHRAFPEAGFGKRDFTSYDTAETAGAIGGYVVPEAVDDSMVAPVPGVLADTLGSMNGGAIG